MTRHWFSVYVLALGLLLPAGKAHAQFGGSGVDLAPSRTSVSTQMKSRFLQLPDKESLDKLQAPCTDSHLDRTFAEWIELLKADTGLPVVLDHQALTDSGVETDTVIQGNFEGLMWSEALDLALPQMNIDYLISGRTVRFTSSDTARDTLIVSTYDLHALLREGPLGEPALLDAGSLIELIQSVVPAGQWADRDGEGGNLQLVGQRLIVSQNQRGHAAIELALAQLSEGLTEETRDPVVVTYRIYAPDVLHSDRGEHSQGVPAPQMGGFFGMGASLERPSLTPTPPASETPGATATQARAEKFAEDLSKIVTEMVAMDSWEANGGMGTIRSVPGALVVRQTPQVHRELRTVLKPFLEATRPASSTRSPHQGSNFMGTGLGGMGGFGS